MSNNSTNVRFFSSLLSGLGTVSPRGAGRLAFELLLLHRPRRVPSFSPAPDAVEHFRAGGRRIASYVWQGGGPTVLLVHGWNGGSGDLAAVHRSAAATPAAGWWPSTSPGTGDPRAGASTSPSRWRRWRRASAASRPSRRSSPIPSAFRRRCSPQGGARRFPGRCSSPGPSRWRRTSSGSRRCWRSLRSRPARCAHRVKRVLEEGGLETMDLGVVAPRLPGRALVIHDRGDREVPFLSAQALHRAWAGSELLATDGLGHRRLLSDPRVVERAVRFAVGWDRTAEALVPPAPPELRVVAG